MFKVLAITIELLMSVNGQPKNVSQSYSFYYTENDSCVELAKSSVEKSKRNMIDAFSSVGVSVIIENMKYVDSCN